MDNALRSLRIEGLIYFQQDPTLLDQALDYMNWRKDTKLYVDKFEMQVSYWPDRTNMPQFESTLKAAT